MKIVGEVLVEVYDKDWLLKDRRFSRNSITSGDIITAVYASGDTNLRYQMVKGIELYSDSELKDKNYTGVTDCSSAGIGHHAPTYTVDSVSYDNDDTSAWFEIVAIIQVQSSYSITEERLVTADYECVSSSGSPTLHVTTFATHTESPSIDVVSGDKVKITWKVTIS